MSDLSKQAGFELIRVDAIDAEDPAHQDVLSQMIAKGPTGIVGKGALACTLSHSKAWKMFLDSGQTSAVFLEDDVVLSDDFAKVLEALEKTSHRFDLVKLECGGSAPDGLVLGSSVADLDGRALRPCYQMATDAAAYVLTKAGAKQALERIGSCDVGVDHFLFYSKDRLGASGLEFAIVTPAIAIQDRMIGSNIAKSRYDDAKWRRMIRRTYYELSLVPLMLGKLLRGARVVKVPFEK